MKSSESYNSCPSCGGTIRSPTEAAAHKCPTETHPDPTPDQIKLAELETQHREYLRKKIKPTHENLSIDAQKMVQAVVDGWDQEVEAIVILVPKNSGDATTVRFMPDRERARQILRAVISRLAFNEKKLTHE